LKTYCSKVNDEWRMWCLVVDVLCLQQHHLCKSSCGNDDGNC